jgi:hypothetical protein
MRNNNVVVVVGVSHKTMRAETLSRYCPKFDFDMMYPVFRTLYESAKYFTFVATKTRDTGGEYDVIAIKCKLFVTQFDSTLDTKVICNTLESYDK